MRVVTGHEGREDALIEVFRTAFAASEGADEGDLIADLVSEIFSTTPPDQLRVFFAEEDDGIVGAVAFTSLQFAEDTQRVMLLSPMAVAPERWKTGIGQTLIRTSLAALAGEGVDVALTYGDPAYYGRLGFMQIDETDVQAPLQLSMPHGWLGQRMGLDGKPDLQGPSSCVPAFRRAALW